MKLKMLQDRYLVRIHVPKLSSVIELPEVMDSFGYGIIEAEPIQDGFYASGTPVLFDQHDEVLHLEGSLFGSGRCVILREDSILGVFLPDGSLQAATGYIFLDPDPLPALWTTTPKPEQGWIFTDPESGFKYVAPYGAGYVIQHNSVTRRLVSIGEILADIDDV